MVNKKIKYEKYSRKNQKRIIIQNKNTIMNFEKLSREREREGERGREGGRSMIMAIWCGEGCLVGVMIATDGQHASKFQRNRPRS